MRPAVLTTTSGARNHANINALRRWALDAYNIRNLIITPNVDSPTTRIDIKADLAAMRSVGCEVAIKTAAVTPAINLTLDTEVTGVGGLDTGKLGSSGLYAVYLAANTDSENGLASSVNVIGSINWEGPTLAAGYTHKRLIGAFATKDNEGIAEIKPFIQVDDWFLYHEAQKAIEWKAIDKSIARTQLELVNWVPRVAEEIHIDAQIYGGTAPFYLKVFEYHTGLEIIDLNPGTGDFGHESVWMFAPKQLVDYSLGVTDAVSGSLRVLGFRMPIDMEF